jgi:hypothetical protein
MAVSPTLSVSAARNARVVEHSGSLASGPPIIGCCQTWSVTAEAVGVDRFRGSGYVHEVTTEPLRSLVPLEAIELKSELHRPILSFARPDFPGF